ncbi:MAG: hypothetical protein R3C11_29215 [Planctomycetaceae bacterium]
MSLRLPTKSRRSQFRGPVSSRYEHENEHGCHVHEDGHVRRAAWWWYSPHVDGSAGSGGSAAEMQAEMDKSMRNQSFGNDLTVESSETKQIMIKGVEESFLFSKANNKQGQAFREITGSFPKGDSDDCDSGSR